MKDNTNLSISPHFALRSGIVLVATVCSVLLGTAFLSAQQLAPTPSDNTPRNPNQVNEEAPCANEDCGTLSGLILNRFGHPVGHDTCVFASDKPFVIGLESPIDPGTCRCEGYDIYHTRTRMDGTFQLKDIPAKMYTVKILTPGYPVLTQPLVPVVAARDRFLRLIVGTNRDQGLAPSPNRRLPKALQDLKNKRKTCKEDPKRCR